MAAQFKVVAQYPTVEFLGGTQTRDVNAVGAVTIPSGVYFEVRVPATSYGATLVNAALSGPASDYEELATYQNVAGVEWSQGTTTSGYLIDNVTITVQSTSGDSTAQITVPFSDLGPKLHEPQIDALNKQLDAIENL